METIFIEKIYEAPLALVWEVITKREHLKQWYFDLPESFKPQPGAVFEWLGGPPDGKQWLHRGKILEIVPGKKLVHSWEYPGYTGISTVTWELKEETKGKTKLIFSHVFNVPFDPSQPDLVRGNFVEGWNSILNSGLSNYLSGIQKT